MDITERLLYLRSLPAGSELSPDLLLQLASQATEQTYDAEALVARQDEPITRILFVMHGTATLRQDDLVLGLARPPGAVGVLPLLAGVELPFDLRAETDLVTLEVDAEAYLELIEDHFELWLALLRVTYARLLAHQQRHPQLFTSGHPFFTTSPLARSPGLVDRILMMRRSGLFGPSSVNALAEVAQQLELVSLDAAQTLYQDGDASDAIYVLFAGALEFQATSDGSRTRIEPGASFGGPEALAERPRWGTVVALAPSHLLRLSVEILLDVMEDNTEMALAYLQTVSRALLELDLAQRKGERLMDPQAPLRAFDYAALDSPLPG